MHDRQNQIPSYDYCFVLQVFQDLVNQNQAFLTLFPVVEIILHIDFRNQTHDVHECEAYSHPDEVPNPICEHEYQIVR